jgi:threonine/homoserine/homoserine lactone efflux protein
MNSVMDIVWPVVLFAAVTTLTPGPNTLMLTASGASYGFWRTFPQIIGVSVGIPVLIMAVGLGLGTVLQSQPTAHLALRVLGAAYLLWLAWKIATARRAPSSSGNGGSSNPAATETRPINLVQAALLQWVNPKVWTMALGAIGAYTTIGGDVVNQSIVIAIIFGVICIPAGIVWTTFGVAIRRWLTSERALRVFNGVMATLLVVSLVPMVRG